MTVEVTKYLRLTGGCGRAHSPIVIAGVERRKVDSLIDYLKG